MALIDSSAVFPTPEAICLCDSLNLSISPRIFQDLSVPFNDGSMKEHGKNVLNYLNLVKDILQTCKVEREISNQRNIQEMKKVV